MSELWYAGAGSVLLIAAALWAAEIPQSVWRASAVRRRANRKCGVFGEGWGRG